MPLRPSILVLVAVSAINPAAINIFIPSMASMEAVFHTDFATVQLTLSLYLVGVALSQLIIGPLSDRFGRRPVLLWGLALFAAGSLVCALAPTIEVLILGRLVQAFGGCAGIVLGRAIVRDMYERDAAASMIGYVTMGMAVAPMVSPVLGGLLHEAYGWQASFYLLAVASAIVLMWSWFVLHETNRNIGQADSIGDLLASYKVLLGDTAFWAFMLCAALSAGLFFGFLGGAPFVSQTLLGLTPGNMGLFFMLVAAGFVGGNYFCGRYATRAGVARMITIGSVIAALAVALMAALFAVGSTHPMALFGPMMIIAFANGLSLPSAMAGAVSVRPNLAGAASGLSGSMQIGFGAVVTFAVGEAVTSGPGAGTIWPIVGVLVFCAAAWIATVVWANAVQKS